MPRKGDPPFDGKPCPACASEIRNLAAVAHNTITAWRGRPYKLDERLQELEAALALVQPLMDAHFADRMHSHGEVDRAAQVSGDGKEG
jgi:hypothetical protein